MHAYENWLANRGEGNYEKEDILRNEFHNRWIIGSDEFRSAVQQRFENIEISHYWGGSQLQELIEGKWEKIVQDELSSRCLKESDLLDSPKLVGWKIQISRLLRTHTIASNRWIADRLNMGHPSNVSRYLKRMPKSKG